MTGHDAVQAAADERHRAETEGSLLQMACRFFIKRRKNPQKISPGPDDGSADTT
jgi:hypothetical protein